MFPEMEFLNTKVHGPNIHFGKTFWKDYRYIDGKYNQKSQVYIKKRKQTKVFFFSKISFI